MVDKYEAKKYVADRIGQEHIVPTLGIYNTFDEINFNSFSAGDSDNFLFRLFDIAGDYHERFETEDVVCYVDIAVEDLVQFIPFGVFMRPCKLDAALWFPFRRKSHNN